MAAVLCYHRLNSAPPPSDVWSLSVSIENFRDQLAYLKSTYAVIPVGELEKLVRAGEVPKGVVSVTFDDGYYNNLILAKPALEEAKLPATIFVATGFIGKEAFWWDRLEAIVAERIKEPAYAATRIYEYWRSIRDVSLVEKEAHLDLMARNLTCSPNLLDENRPLAAHEIIELRSDFIDIGCHTVHHPWLPSISDETMAWEIAASKMRCEELIGSPVNSLAYPYGACDERTQSIARCAGIEIAFTTVPAKLEQDCSLTAIPRMCVENWSVEELEKRLHMLRAVRTA